MARVENSLFQFIDALVLGWMFLYVRIILTVMIAKNCLIFTFMYIISFFILQPYKDSPFGILITVGPDSWCYYTCQVC
jgi:hypothetical protein